RPVCAAGPGLAAHQVARFQRSPAAAPFPLLASRLPQNKVLLVLFDWLRRLRRFFQLDDLGLELGGPRLMLGDFGLERLELGGASLEAFELFRLGAQLAALISQPASTRGTADLGGRIPRFWRRRR